MVFANIRNFSQYCSHNDYIFSQINIIMLIIVFLFMENSKIKPNERKYIRQKIAALKKNTN